MISIFKIQDETMFLVFIDLENIRTTKIYFMEQNVHTDYCVIDVGETYGELKNRLVKSCVKLFLCPNVTLLRIGIVTSFIPT